MDQTSFNRSKTNVELKKNYSDANPNNKNFLAFNFEGIRIFEDLCKVHGAKMDEIKEMLVDKKFTDGDIIFNFGRYYSRLAKLVTY